MGGDRDGHPLVTAETTQETLREMRHHALILVRCKLERLASKLSLSGRFQSPSGAMEERMETLLEKLGSEGMIAFERNLHEPWRQFVNLIIEALPGEAATRADSESGRYSYRRHTELLADLDSLSRRHAGALLRLVEQRRAELRGLTRALPGPEGLLSRLLNWIIPQLVDFFDLLIVWGASNKGQ